MPLIASTRIQEGIQEGRCQLVYTNCVKFLRFDQGKPSCLGTMDLNGGTAVAIISGVAVILAHIGSRAPNSGPTDITGDALEIRIMATMQSVFNMHRDCFPDLGTNAVVVYGANKGEVTSPDQVKTVCDKLGDLMLLPGCASYEVTPAAQRSQAAGTFLVEGRHEQREAPAAYVENVQVGWVENPTTQ